LKNNILEAFELNTGKRFANKKLFFNLLKIIITASLLVYLINIIDYKKIIETLGSANYIFVLSALLLTGVNVFLQYKKWEIICRHSLNIFDKGIIAKSLFIGFSGGIVTPFKIGEFVARAIPIKTVGIIEISLATFIDKLFPLIVVSFIGGLSALLFVHYFHAVNILITVSLLIIYIILFYFLFIIVNNKKFWNDIIFDKISQIRFLKNHVSKFKLLGKLSSKITWQLTFITFLYYLTFTTQMALLIAAFLHQYDLLNYLWISNLVIFSQTIIPQVTIAELGIREGSTVFFMNLVGLSAAAGFNAAIILFFINLVLPSIVGLFLIITKKYD